MLQCYDALLKRAAATRSESALTALNAAETRAKEAEERVAGLQAQVAALPWLPAETAAGTQGQGQVAGVSAADLNAQGAAAGTTQAREIEAAAVPGGESAELQAKRRGLEFQLSAASAEAGRKVAEVERQREVRVCVCLPGVECHVEIVVL